MRGLQDGRFLINEKWSFKKCQKILKLFDIYVLYIVYLYTYTIHEYRVPYMYLGRRMKLGIVDRGRGETAVPRRCLQASRHAPSPTPKMPIQIVI